MMTLTQRLTRYLEAHGFQRVTHASRKYTAFRGTTGAGHPLWYFLGKAGAVYRSPDGTLARAIGITDLAHRDLRRWEQQP